MTDQSRPTTDQPDPARLAEVTIERIVPGGHGLAHAEGLTVFVRGAAPGDRLQIRLDRQTGRVAFGSVVSILSAGPDRATPPCPVYDRCGGCDFQHLTDRAQLAAKVEIVRDCLQRIAGLNPVPPIAAVPSPISWGYRTRADWHIDRANRRVGYLTAGSHHVVGTATCPILMPQLERALRSVGDELAGRRPGRGIARVRAVGGDESVVVATGTDTTPITTTVGGERYQYDAGCFFQANRPILPALLAAVLADLPQPDDPAPGLALDLYCGVGLFTVPLARRFRRVIGVEAHARAARWARRNLAALANATIDTATTGDWLRERVRGLGPVALVVLDPPRTGAEPEAIEALRRIAPRQIVYVSCDPATLARDLKRLLTGNRYDLRDVTVLDLFPQTHHVESVVRLSRADQPDDIA